MDGLTISTSKTLLDRGQTLKEIGDSRLQTEIRRHSPAKGQKSFADTLKDAVQTSIRCSNESDVKMQEIATGKNHNMPEVMITAEKADISLKLMVQVRNKIIEAYQEIMKMQV